MYINAVANLESPGLVGLGGGVRLCRGRGNGGEVVQGEIDALAGPGLDQPRTLARAEPCLLGRDARQVAGVGATVAAGDDADSPVAPTRRPLARLHCTPSPPASNTLQSLRHIESKSYHIAYLFAQISS